MKYLQFLLGLLAIVGVLLIDSCSSGKKAYEHGNYYESVMTSVARLRRNTDHKKSVETLRQAYPLAVKYFEDQANNAIASSAEFKWTSVVQSYTAINSMYDEIKRSPGALAVIPNPVNYHSNLEAAKRNAAEENYQAGILALTTGNREKAKLAYRYFKTANEYVVGYKDVIKMMEQALWNATVKVLITPIPATKNVAWSAQFFDDKISEFLHGVPINEFVKFYTYSEAQTLKLNPDHIVELTFDEFTVGQVTLHEKQIQLEKDSVVLATYITPTAAGNQTTSSGNGSTNVVPGNTNPTSGNSSSNSGNQNGANTNTGSNTNTNTNTGNANSNTNTDNTNSNANTNTGNQNNTNTGNQNNQGNSNQNNQGNSGSQGNTGNQSGTGNQGGGANQNQGNTGNHDHDSDKKDDDGDKVTICHKPPGNTENAQTLIIPRSALQAHLDHGDALGYCDDSKDKGKTEDKKDGDKKSEDKKGEDDKKSEDKKVDEKKEGEKKEDEKKQEDKKSNKPDGLSRDAGEASNPLLLTRDELIASTSARTWLASLINLSGNDTTKVYGKVKATYYHYQKTTTSKGIVSFRIIDAKTKAILSAEKMPGEYVWISEWATFNGDERALSPLQLEIARQKERVPPPVQDLFMEFTKPIYNQITTKIQNFYKGY